MRKLLPILAAIAVIAPTSALAGKPPHPTQAKNTTPPKVLYVLRGALSHYTAATATALGSITIDVASANRHGKELKKQTLTFPLDAKTRIVLHDAAPIADGDRGVVKLRGPKKLDLTALQAVTLRQVIDHGAATTSS